MRFKIVPLGKHGQSKQDSFPKYSLHLRESFLDTSQNHSDNYPFQLTAMHVFCQEEYYKSSALYNHFIQNVCGSRSFNYGNPSPNRSHALP
jgi:hypothetical protein